MPTTSKSSKKTTPAAAAGKPEFADAFTPLYVNGVERLAELQKKSLDIAAEQSTEFLNTWKKAFSFLPATRDVCIRHRRAGGRNLRRDPKVRDRLRGRAEPHDCYASTRRGPRLTAKSPTA